jgi:hypothetical protein
MPRKGFAVFDADSHIIESRELWERYLEPEYRVAGRLALWREEGKLGSYLKINGEVRAILEQSLACGHHFRDWRVNFDAAENRHRGAEENRG